MNFKPKFSEKISTASKDISPIIVSSVTSYDAVMQTVFKKS